MKYTTVFVLALCLGLASCTQDRKEVVSAEAKIQEIIASDEFQNANSVLLSNDQNPAEALKNAQIYDALLGSLKGKLTPDKNIYAALREAVLSDASYDETTRKSVLEIIDDRENDSENMQNNMQKLYQRYPELKDASFRNKLLKQVQNQHQITKQ